MDESFISVHHDCSTTKGLIAHASGSLRYSGESRFNSEWHIARCPCTDGGRGNSSEYEEVAVNRRGGRPGHFPAAQRHGFKCRRGNEGMPGSSP